MFGTRTDNRKIVLCARFRLSAMSKECGRKLLGKIRRHACCAAPPLKSAWCGWRKGSGMGWLTPNTLCFPHLRRREPRARRRVKGRSQEIERLIGRSLRNVCDMANMGGEVTMTIDCDVLQAMVVRAPQAITGAWVAAYDAFEMWRTSGKGQDEPFSTGRLRR